MVLPHRLYVLFYAYAVLFVFEFGVNIEPSIRLCAYALGVWTGWERGWQKPCSL